MESGILNIYKEKGYTSFDVVAKLRGILHIKKIGHTGTVDPQAEGVLPVCIGKATKVCSLLTDKDKEYEAVMRLGVTTDTQDMTGQALSQSSVCVDEVKVRSVIAGFVGEISQIPPMYSALKVNGRKLCDLARQGVEVERDARKVTVYRIDVLAADLPFVTIRVHCSKGTYIRTLCHDIGAALGCGGAMESLVRTRVADFTLAESITLAQVENALRDNTISRCLCSIDKVFERCGKRTLREESVKKMTNGAAALPQDLAPGQETAAAEGSMVRLYLPDGRFLGIYRWEKGCFHLQKMFLE